MTQTILRIVFIVCLFPLGRLTAQHDDHSHGRNEIGLSTGAVYALDDKAWGTGAHFHYYRTLSPHSKWAVGVMAEYARVHTSHFTLGAGIKFEPFDRFGIGILPGATFLPHHHDESEGHDGRVGKAVFSTHFELVYDLFRLKKFHLGPVLDYSWSMNDSHLMLGLHIAYCF